MNIVWLSPFRNLFDMIFSMNDLLTEAWKWTVLIIKWDFGGSHFCIIWRIIAWEDLDSMIKLEVHTSLAWCSLPHSKFELVPADWLGRSKSTRDCKTSEFFASYAKQNWWNECIAGQRTRSFKKGYRRCTSCHQGNPSLCWRYQKSWTSNGRGQ